MTSRQVLRSRRVELPSGTGAADVVIEAGRIIAVDPHGSCQQVDQVRDFGDLALLPGLVDSHVHLNEPGRTEWEGFQSGTAAAKAGGVTTIVDMPLNSSPVTVTLQALQQKRSATTGKLHVDVGFHAGLVPENPETVDELILAGARAAKAFLCPSGMPEFQHASEDDLRIAMPKLAAIDAVLMVHAELIHDVPPIADPHRYHDYMASRPPSFEANAIEMLIPLAKRFGCRVHIVHLADAACLPTIKQAQDDGVRLTVETCPHYLHFESDSIGDGRTEFKCAPPIRNADNRESLWEGIRQGVIDMVVSDHSPCPPELKELQSGRFDKAWGGISSLELGLPVVWTDASRRGFTLSDVVGWMSRRPAELLGIAQGISPGNPAHLVVFDAETRFVVDQTKLSQRHPVTPYHGESLRGIVRQTFVHGQTTNVSGKMI